MLLIQVKNGLMYKGGPSLSVNLQYLDIIYVCFNYSETEIETHTPKKKKSIFYSREKNGKYSKR